jgi:hypothetical protein
MNCTEETDKLCSRIIKGKSILLRSVGLTLQNNHLKNAKFKTSVLKAVLYDCQHFIPTWERFTQYPPQNHPYFPSSLISSVPCASLERCIGEVLGFLSWLKVTCWRRKDFVKNALPQHSIPLQLSYMLFIRLLLEAWEETRPYFCSTQVL